MSVRFNRRTGTSILQFSRLVRWCVQRAVRLACVGLCFASCATSSIQFFDDPPPLQIQTQWQTKLDYPEPIAYYPKQYAVPVISRSGNTVIAGSERGTLIAVDARTGRERWSYQTYGKIRSAPLIVGRSVYFGATDGKLYRLSATQGTLQWDAPYATQGAISSAPVVAGKYVLFQNNENRTYAVNASTGQYRWDQGRPRSTEMTMRGEGGIAVADETVYAGYDDGYLAAMRLEDGATLWSKNLAGKARQFVDVDTRPLVIEDAVYAASYSSGLYCLERKYGGIRWLYPARGVVTPAYGNEMLFVASSGGNVVALKPDNGDVLWRARFEYAELGQPVFDGGRLWVTTGDGLLLMSATRGRTLSRITPHNGLSSSVAARAGRLYMVTNSGALVGARLL